eukprot:TRINITY_DN6337_c0_g1_i1.p1 TRINITY_DN6337_c0_g1~~TRINITY_DN6337_c0_g1_i1.p1  ORF type:complete len:364 (-),score=58.15 TRINITY_DN6337_c0_g1_i1:6-1097(-)
MGCRSTTIILLSVLIGLMYSGTLTKVGVLPFLASFDARLKGCLPGLTSDVESAFHFDHVPQGALNGKVALVTGANSGIGYWTAHHLARKGATVVLACRSAQSCEMAANWIKGNSTDTEVLTRTVDVSSLTSVEEFTKQFLKDFERLDILVCNAGIGQASFLLSPDGIESTFATNHLGHFKMYTDLEDLIVKSASENGMATVVAVSSRASYDAKEVIFDLDKLNDPENFSTWKYYGLSKLYNILFVQEINARVGSKNVYANAVHPGVVATNIWSSAQSRATTKLHKFLISCVQAISVFFWSPEDGARSQFYLAAAWSELKENNIKGSYFHPIAAKVTPNPLAANVTLQKQLWEFSEKVLRDKGY